MTELASQLSKIEDVTSWRSLTVFAGYRFLLAAMLLAAFHFGLPPGFLGESAPELFNITSQLYFLAAVALLFATTQRWSDLQTQVKIQLLIDIVFITILIHASGGLKTSLGSLLVIVVVAGGVLVPGRLAIFIAALATIAVLFQAVYADMFTPLASQYSSAGILGATFFATAILTHILSRKIVESQQLAEQRAADIENLAMLNSHIISRMQTGVLVINNAGQIQLSNFAARQLLGLGENSRLALLKALLPDLGEQLGLWKKNSARPFTPVQAQAHLPELAVSGALLDSGEAVLYLENMSSMAQQVQQLKLASLGQLTASIAHEVRNPLSAINHASELLAELEKDRPETNKLTDIIQRHSGRVNNIIETVLEMSRRKTVDPSVVVLASWAEQVVAEFTEAKQLPDDAIAINIAAPLARVYLDKDQLHQVLWNLLENAWQYADKQKPGSAVTISVAQKRDDAILDVIDNGPGVSKAMQKVLFEPFQSERQGGTGLGLYLARELCQANGVRLNYVFDEVKKSCFRMQMPIRQPESLK